MKKRLALILAVLLVISILAGCDGDSGEETSAPTDSVVATEPTTAPTETETPTEEPTEAPTEEPTEAPTEAETEAPTEVPTEEPTEAPTEPEFTVTAISKTMYVTQWANIRIGPGTTYDRITALDRGTAVYCIGVADNGWYKIKYNGGEAYIAGNLVSDTKPVDPPAETDPPATEPPTTEPPATEHKHNYTSSVTAPTCTDKGYTTYTCSCGDSYKADETAATGHSMVETERVDYTCDAPGYYTMTCSACGHSETNEIPIHSDYVLGYIEAEGEEGEHGYCKIYSCPNCEYLLIEVLKIEPHNDKVVFECPCGPIAYIDYECSDCGYTHREHVDPTYPEHNYVEVEGLEPGFRKCTQCGSTAYSSKWE